MDDAYCDGNVDFDDLKLILRTAADLPDGGGSCPASLGIGTQGVETRDVNCDQAIDALDALDVLDVLDVLLSIAGLAQLPLPTGCVLVGESL